MDKLFTSNDLELIKKRGSNPEQVSEQFNHFKKGFDFADLQRAATVGDGIIRLTESEKEKLLSLYSKLIEGKRIVKFVPASGAASRMFKEPFTYLEAEDEPTRTKALQLIHSLKDYALYDDLAAAMKRDGLKIEERIANGDYKTVLSYLLEEKGLNYGKLPKGMLQFHRYETECRTAFEEHLVEAAHYARCSDGSCHLHFTVSPQHQPLFEQRFAEVKNKYEQRHGVHYDVTFSTQKPGTDTLAATEDNLPFRDENGNLLFRPGGHGALIQNLGNIDADVVFVKNIDNVMCDQTLDDTLTYKKVLAAYLLLVQKQIFEYQELLSSKEEVDTETIQQIQRFVKERLMQDAPAERTALLEILSRPIRVCGMVKNEGEPGGGPFFVKSKNGKTTLQIVESAQIDKSDTRQKEILTHATHFNPVDMVCAFKDGNGKSYPLNRFVDAETGFISSKSYEGRTLKAMELPGLWNGAMAHWNTLFIEVPLSTFHPVKTLFDLKIK